MHLMLLKDRSERSFVFEKTKDKHCMLLRIRCFRIVCVGNIFQHIFYPAV